MDRDSLDRVAAQVRSCTRCRLASSRSNAVPGRGRQAIRFPTRREPFMHDLRRACELAGLA